MAQSLDSVTAPALDPDLVASFAVTRPGTDGAKAILENCCVAVCTRNRPEAVLAFMDSLAGQHSLPAEMLVVDASDGTGTEQAVRGFAAARAVAERTTYVRVAATKRGLTRQRNLALRLVSLPLIAFFDDDILLEPECLGRLVAAHRDLGEDVAGVAAYIENERLTPPMLWRMRRYTGIVSTLKPGRYCASGISTPWGFLPPTEARVGGDWLPGGATMWRTDLARAIRFEDGFAGYGSGEDLDFSLRIGRHGLLVLAGDARVQHLKADGGRPDGYDTGYRGLANHYHIHRWSMPNRRRRHLVWFLYAFLLDTLIRASGLLRPSRREWTSGFVRGRLRFFLDLAAGRIHGHG
jgi:GT2 family glycosyltransferase